MKVPFRSLGCGIDVSAKTLDVCLGGRLADNSFKIIATKSKVKNTPAGVRDLVAWLEAKTAPYRSELTLEGGFQILLEATGSYHEKALFALHHAGLPVCLERPDRVQKFIRSLGQYSKNDQIDARAMAQMACQRKLRLWKPFSPRTLELRGIERHRNSLVKSHTQYQNRLHALEAGHYQNPQVKASIKRTIKHLNSQIEKLEREMLRVYKEDEELQNFIDPIFQSLPCVGVLSLIIIFAETNGFDQIKSRRKLASYAGFDVIQNQSGQYAGRTRISKRGNARIRAAMYMCAVSVAGRKKGPMYEKYVRLVARNPKAKKIALVAIGRDLLQMVFTLYRSGKRYDENHRWRPSPPKANRPSTANKDASETSPEARGIAA